MAAFLLLFRVLFKSVFSKIDIFIFYIFNKLYFIFILAHIQQMITLKFNSR